MRLKWKLRLYYGALLVVLLALLAGATSALVLHQFRRERERREAEASHLARRLLEDRMASIDSAVARAVRDPELQLLARRDLAGSRSETLGDWVPLAGKLAQLHGLPVLKVLDGEGIVLSSAHWPAAYNVTDSPGLVLALEAGKGARLVRESVADGEFLALEAPRWLQPQVRRYLVIGGVRADSGFAADLAERAGIPLHFEMRDPPSGAAGDTTLARATKLAPSPGRLDWLPLPTSPVEASGGVRLRIDRTGLLGLQRRLAQMFLAGTVLGGVVAWMLGWWISSRVTRPLEQLAENLAVVADGGTPRPIHLQGSAEVQDLVISFNRMNDSLSESRERLRRAERITAWREVARRVAHEIKNSLAPIQISVDSVARSMQTGRGDLKSLVDESTATVRGEVEALTRLVNAFNEMARLPDPEVVAGSLAETWERAAAPFRDRLEVDSRRLETLPRILHDPDQVRRAFHNLLLNAQEAGATRATLEAVPVPRGYRLVLADDGPGVPAEDLENVFEPYFTRKPEGTGLGLAIVYKICTDHGWTVVVRSPAEPAAGGHTAPSEIASAPGAPGRPGTAFVIGIPPRSAAEG